MMAWIGLKWFCFWCYLIQHQLMGSKGFAWGGGSSDKSILNMAKGAGWIKWTQECSQ